jgi:hypothetical protein
MSDTADKELLNLLTNHLHEVPEEELAEVQDALNNLPTQAIEAETAPTTEDTQQTKRIDPSKLKIAVRIKLALFGNSITRAQLIRDPLKLVHMAVLKNARVTQKEIEDFASNPNLSEHILRGISDNPTYNRSYTVKRNLVFNPKTPQDIALKWIKFLNATDIKLLARSRNIPQLIANAAKKKLADAN